MPYDQYLAERIENTLQSMQLNYFAKKMMGGLIFMVNDKMFCGIHYSKKKETHLLMARIGEDASSEALKKEGCHPMDFTGRPMKGFVFVTPDGYDRDDDLTYWLELCKGFNPFAKATKKKST